MSKLKDYKLRQTWLHQADEILALRALEIKFDEQIESLQSELSRYKLTWTSEVPTEAGWYWVKSHHGYFYAVSLEQSDEGVFLIDPNTGEAMFEVRRTGGTFAGPIPQPEGETDGE